MSEMSKKIKELDPEDLRQMRLRPPTQIEIDK